MPYEGFDPPAITMPEAPVDIQKPEPASRIPDDTQGLAQAVDQLVSEIDRTIDTFGQDREGGVAVASAQPAPRPSEEIAALQDQVDDLLDDATTVASEEIDEIEDAASAGDYSSQSSIVDLDDSLASAADDDNVVDGDIEDSSLLPEHASTVLIDDKADEAPVHAAPPIAPAPVALDKSARHRRPRRSTKDTLAHAARALETPARVISMPLRIAPPAHRDTIGWIALNTLFLAICVWLYVVLA